MTVRFLIDECLSKELVAVAVAAGYPDSTSVAFRGRLGTKDWDLIDYVVAHDYTLVTHNSPDFRGGGPAALGGEHNRQAIHAGLVCLNWERQPRLAGHVALFRLTLAEIERRAALVPPQDLVNHALEAFQSASGVVTFSYYEIPKPPADH